MIDNLFVFDFDDTLATTVSTIGVARSYKEKNDIFLQKNHIFGSLPYRHRTTLFEAVMRSGAILSGYCGDL